jgi:hypothetical protein
VGKEQSLSTYKKKDRQAVVVIHGVGEQLPMETLRGFADTILEIKRESEPRQNAGPAYFSTPDFFSDSFELRKLVAREKRPRTDFFEYYWAHRMPTATWSRIWGWLRLLLHRSAADVPPHLVWPWRILKFIAALIFLLLLATIVLWFWPIPGQAWLPMTQSAAPLGIAALLALVQGFILNYAGDAAVYLSPSPRNIEARNAIRSAGVTLLDKIHESGKYDRIIVVGHSLGSVIGYDVLTYLWQLYNEKHDKPTTPPHEVLDRAEELAAKSEPQVLSNNWAETTRRLWVERRSVGCPWLVTDFVTLGSPLTHAQLLLAQDALDFTRRKNERELPTSPPYLEHGKEFSFSRNYVLPSNEPRTIRVLHHAAWTAVVRWSNLYFPARVLLFGDFIGGPVATAFGHGVQDRAVSTRKRFGWFSHTLYWDPDKRDADVKNSSVSRLREAVDLRGLSFPANCEYASGDR